MFRSSGRYLGLLVIGSALGLSNCQSKSVSQQVQISVLQPQPIVFNTPLSYTNAGGTATTLSGPWMEFQVIINNTSAYPVTIEAVTLTIRDNVNPQSTPLIVTLAPATDGYTTTAANGATITCVFADFGEFDPGGTPTGSPPFQNGTTDGKYNDTALFEIPAQGSTACPVGIPHFYVGSLPTSGPSQTTFSYSVEVQPVGWFGSRTQQTGRFQNYAFFTTQ